MAKSEFEYGIAIIRCSECDRVKTRRGKWIVGTDGSYMCSECNKVFRYEIGNYCSNCGVRLEYEENG